MIYRCILPKWLQEQSPNLRKTYEGEFTPEELKHFNENFYNIYFFPNCPTIYDPSKPVDGSDIDCFRYVFADMDLKDNVYANKEDFINFVNTFELTPSLVVDSGNGIHVYWEVSDLDALSFLRLQRRICRKFKTDEAVSKIAQLMRVPGYVNPKVLDNLVMCDIIQVSNNVYSCEQLDSHLPIITQADDQYCKDHFEKTYNLNNSDIKVDDKLPVKFGHLLKTNREVSELWKGNTDDRSKADYRIGHIMFASGFTKEEARSVLVNTAKALDRAPKHRISYAEGIIDKIWTYELTPQEDRSTLNLSASVKDLLEQPLDKLEGTRFPCWTYLDNTDKGFRLGQVIGLVAGSGVGKTAIALNMFEGFVTANPNYIHFFIPLEQPANEIAQRWKAMCGNRTDLYEKVHIISNYDENGQFRHLSFDDIKEYILKFQRLKNISIGCVVIDHIGALKKKGKNGENQDLMDICHAMKAFAVETKTMLVMQSQAPREKAGIGDLELNKDAAYGTVYFESYCDYLITAWQPLKRCYSNPQCPTVTAFKFCKIRHKKQGKDIVKEDVPYILFFDPNTEKLRDLTQEEEISFNFFLKKATGIRKQDRKTDIVTYASIYRPEVKKEDDRKISSDSNLTGVRAAEAIIKRQGLHRVRH